MAKNFIFQKMISGSLETLYPKTVVDNVVRETSDGEKKLDAILDEKGAFKEFTEQVADESTETDLLFEVLGDVVGSEIIQSIRGTIVGDTPPEDTNYLWVDKSSDVASIKFYDEDEKAWKPISLGTGGGSGSIDDNTFVELDSDIEE